MNAEISLGTGRTSRQRQGNPQRTSKEVKLATWNVRTLYRARAAQQLADTLSKYNTDITAIQEIRWTGCGVLQNRDYDIYYSCHAKHHALGVGFLVSKKMKYTIIGFKNINERLCTIRVRGKFRNISLINVHAPTEESSSDDKEEFYDLVEQALDACPKYDVKIILGDLNAKIGREPVFRQYIGNNSLHENTNDNGYRLIDLAASNNMVVASTRFARKDSHKITWISPDGVTRNQIDHVLIDRRHYSNLRSVRTYRGANIDSNHHLVGVVITMRITMRKSFVNADQVRLNTNALVTDEATQNTFRTSLDKAIVQPTSPFEIPRSMEKRHKYCH